MSDKLLPVIQVPLSELVIPSDSNVSLDLNETIDQNNKRLLETSFVEVDHSTQIYTPFYNVSSLVRSVGTDARSIKEVLTEAEVGEVKLQNKEVYLAQGCVIEYLYERIEQPRDTSQQALIKSTIDTVNLVSDLSYTGIIEQIKNASIPTSDE